VPPSGTVAFLFTDVEGSTSLARSRPDEFQATLEQHQAILREAFARHAGFEVGTEGDSFFVVFSSPLQALRAAVEGQQALGDFSWPSETEVRVRMGLHLGEATMQDGQYFGLDIHRAARLAAAGHGGQILASPAIAAVLADRLPAEIAFRDLGKYRLKDFDVPASIFQVTGPGLATDFPALRSVGGPPTNLPAQLTSFVGRERELGELRALAQASPLVSLIGTGGAGKTRLMLQAAAEELDRRPDGAWLVELASIADPDQVDDEVVRTLGVHSEPGRAVLDGLIDFLRSKSLLLLLDNCEHVIGSAADLAVRLTQTCPALTILASSREALGVPGEVVFPVPSLAVPGRRAETETDRHRDAADDWVSEIGSAEAVRLFVDRATAALPSFALTRENADAVAEICRRLDGIPLAVELAAARVTILSPEEIALRLGDRFRLLTGGRRTAVPRQQTLKALFDWSWDLLEEADRRLLRRLSVFAGGWTLEAAQTVTEQAPDGDAREARRVERDEAFETLQGLGRLVDRSLVVVDRGARTRYRLLETIRQYASDRLDAAGEASAVRSRHLAFFLALALEAEPALRGPDMVPWLDRLAAEGDNVRAALEWSFEADTEAALRLCVAVALYWRSRSVGLEEPERLGQAAVLALRLPHSGPGVERERIILVARVLAAAASAASLWASASLGHEWAEQAVSMARDVGDDGVLCEALSARALTAIFSGRSEDARAAGAEVIQLARPRKDWWVLALTETSLALSDMAGGRPDVAEARIVAATEAAKRSGNPFVIAFAANTRGQISGLLGRLDDARRSFVEAIAAYGEMRDGRFVLIARSDLAHALRRSGAVAEAEALYRETLHAWQHAGSRGAIANQLESFGLLAIGKQDPLRAARLFGAAESIREAAGAVMLPHERSEYDAAVARLRDNGDPASVDAAWADGRRLTLDEAVAFAVS
jgi:predicted ATPase/class 3 adenylate cyclase